MSAIPYKHYPLDSPDAPWDAQAEVAKASIDDLSIMCAWDDTTNPAQKNAYKLPHHKADTYHTNLKGVIAAGNAIMGARGGVEIPKYDMDAVKAHLQKHYHEFGKTAPWVEAWMGDKSKECIKVYNYMGMTGHLSISFAPRFYQSVSLPYETRWGYCNLPEQAKKVKQLPVPTEPYIFIHTDIKRKFVIDESKLPAGSYKVYAVPYRLSILSYADLIINASEIHVIDSCFLHLVEYFPLIGKVVYHKYARNNANYEVYRHRLNVVN